MIYVCIQEQKIWRGNSKKAQHRHTHRYKQKTTCTGYDTGGDRPPGRSWLKAFCPGPRRRMWGYHHSCYQARSAQQRPWRRQQQSVAENVKIGSRVAWWRCHESWDKEGSLLGDGWERRKFVEAAAAVIHRKRTKSSEFILIIAHGHGHGHGIFIY